MSTVGSPSARDFAVLGSVLLALIVASLCLGAMAIEPRELLGVVLHRLGFAGVASDGAADAVVVDIRLPRLLSGIAIGALLAIAGSAMQGLFRNPLAEPGLVGVSSGAAFGAVAMIVLGWRLPSAWQSVAVSAAAFLGCLVGAQLIVVLGRLRPGSVSALLLVGIALNAVLMAGTGVLLFAASDAQIRAVTFWTMGSLGGATWASVTVLLPLATLSLLGLTAHRTALDLLLLGDDEARHLGLDVARTRRRLIFVTAIGVGAAVAASGIISFVGLIAPHLVRVLRGPAHRGLMPRAALLGAILLVSADLIARLVVAPAELPVGVVTALIGGPFFLWVLLRREER